MITIFNLFFAISAVSSASIISLDIEPTKFKVNILLDGHPFNFSKSTLTTKKPTSPPNDYTYLSTKSVSTSLIPTPEPIKKPKSCAELLLQGNKISGVYTIYPPIMYETNPFQVYCDMETKDGGWTVFQRRDDYEPRENFTRNWHNYKVGFGNLEKEFWLGNDYLFILTNQDDVELRIELQDFKGIKTYVVYEQFRIQDENHSYNLSISEQYGSDGNSLIYHNNEVFSTYDRDNMFSCAKQCKGGWWYKYKNCAYANLNGIYFQENTGNYKEGILWYYSKFLNLLKKTEMKIRPMNFQQNINSK